MAGPGELTHLDETGAARMVDVGDKAETERRAVAVARLVAKPDTIAAILAGDLKKGDALGTARIAGIMAAKNTAAAIPLCHPLPLTHVAIDIAPAKSGAALIVTATVTTMGKTGVEMEALHAASVAALTLYDMAKALEPGMVIADIRLIEKTGGCSGTFRRADR